MSNAKPAAVKDMAAKGIAAEGRVPVGNELDALRKELESYRNLVESIGEVIYALDTKGDISYVSPIAKRIFGYEPSELLGVNFSSLIHKDDLHLAEQGFRDTSNNKTYQSDFRILRKSGEFCWARTTSYPIKKDDAIAGMTGIIVDITEQKKAEEALQNSKRYAEDLIQTANVMIISLDTKGNIKIFNDAAEKITGYKKQELDGRNWFDTIVPASRYPLVRREFDRLMEGGIFGEFENPILTKSGKERYILWKTSELRENGKIHGIISFGIDITEKKNVEQELLQNSRNLSRAQKIGKQGSWEWDLVHNSLIWSDELYNIWGVGKDFVLTAESIAAMIHPDDRPTNEKNVNALLALGGQSSFELRIICPDKALKYLYQSIEVVRDFSGNPVKLFGIMQDITERKLAEERLNESEINYKSLFMASRDAILTLEPPLWKFLSGNQAAVEMFKAKSEADLVSLEPWKLSPERQPDGRASDEKAKEMNEIALRDGSNLFEWMHRRATGEEFYVDVLLTKVEHRGKVLLYAVVRDITERKRSEEAAKESKAMLQNIINLLPIRIFWKDKNLKYLGCNTVFAHDAGKSSPDELTGKDDFQMGWREQAELYRADDMKVITSGVPKLDYEEMQTTPNGSKIWLFTNKMPLKDKDGKAAGVLGTYMDGTERKQAELAVKESKALVEAVVENIPLMIFLKEAKDLRFVIFNRAGEELLGYDRKDFLGKNNLDLFPPDQAANFMTKDREVLDGKEGFLDIPEEPIMTAKKDQRLLHTRKVRINGEDGVTKYLLGISEDITERKLAEEKLNIKNIILSTQQEASFDGILIVDEQAKIISYNKRFIELWGILPEILATKSDDQLLGSILGKLVEPQKFIEKVKYLYEHKDETSQDDIFLKDGRIFERYSAPMIGQDKKYYGRVWYFHDITEHKQAEDNLRKRKDELERISGFAIDRELKMVELKKQLRELKEKAGIGD